MNRTSTAWMRRSTHRTADPTEAVIAEGVAAGPVEVADAIAAGVMAVVVAVDMVATAGAEIGTD